jgi:CBS-domain-containing membrane protein
MPVVALEAACGEAAAIRSIHTTFGDLTTRRVITIAADSSIVEAAKLRLEHGVSSLSVIDAPHHAVNIVSEHEFCVSY